MDTTTTPFRTGGWRRLTELATHEPQQGARRYALYVIEIESLDDRVPYEFYVGYTLTSGRNRMKQHSEGGKRAARMFRNGRARTIRLREDLTAGLPRYRTKEVALNAEGLLARVITANVGPAYSDQRDVRRKRYEERQTA
jgi:hypothetical protein